MGVAFCQSRQGVDSYGRSAVNISSLQTEILGGHPHIRLRFSRRVGETVLAAPLAARSIDSRGGDQRWDRAAIIRLSRLMELFSANITGALEVILSQAS
jgi:hypothetical protein